MDATELITRGKEFFEKYYEAKLLDDSRGTKKHIVIDFNKLMKFDPDIAQLVLDEPEETLKALEIAIKGMADDHLPALHDDFPALVVRVKNLGKHSKIPINQVRSKHIGRLITVDGVIKQKSEVRGQITRAKFECPSCGEIISCLQLDDRKFEEPSKCKCGRKGKFRRLSHELLDVFSLSVEEPTDVMDGGTKLYRIKVICKGGLTISHVERLLYQGIRAEVSGVVIGLQVIKQGKLTSKMDWYIDANYITVNKDSFKNLKWNEKDIKEFERIANEPDWLMTFRNSIFGDIHGYNEECIGIILQAFGGVIKHRAGIDQRGNIHSLLVGDPGSAKSSMLKIIQKFAPKAMYIAGAGVSGPGITGAVVKDELLGGFTIEAGAIVLCNGGLLCLDELDKVDEKAQKALHEPLEQQTASVDKGGQHGTMIAETAVLAAANPKFGTYSDYESIYNQIDLPSTLINRFDLVYPIRESKLTEEDDEAIAMKILQRGEEDGTTTPKLDADFIRKYIAYAKTINPKISIEVIKFVAKAYRELKAVKRKMNAQNQGSIPISGRNVDSIRRLIQAVARSRLHHEVTMEDAKIGYEKLIYSVQQVGIDPETGDAVEEFVSGKSMTQRDIRARVLNLIRDRTKIGSSTITKDEMMAILKKEGIDKEDIIEDMLEKLKGNVDIFEPRRNEYKILNN